MAAAGEVGLQNLPEQIPFQQVVGHGQQLLDHLVEILMRGRDDLNAFHSTDDIQAYPPPTVSLFLNIYTHVGAVTEEVYAQLVTHAVVTFVVGKLHKCNHFLQRSEGFDALFIIPGFSDCFTDLFEAS